MRAGALVLGGSLVCALPAGAVMREEVARAATRAADRLFELRIPARTWEDAPFLVGVLLLAEQLERTDPVRARGYVERVRAAIGPGSVEIRHGDYGGYAQASLDLYRLDAGNPDVLATTDGPLAFAFRAIRTAPEEGPALDPWWLQSGFGTRFWVDDLFTQPPWLAMRGSSRDGLPGDPLARDLAYEWIESYLWDHRPRGGGPDADVPSLRTRSGPLLWDPALSLFRHDPGAGAASYWARGNGWAAWGLARAARYLDAPYGGGRYDEVVDREGVREVLARLAFALASRRAEDGGWTPDLVDPGNCPASETSATGLVAFMFARGIQEGWLDRETYLPILGRAFALLASRVDAAGDVHAIQPPGTGPACDVLDSSDAAVDLSYGVGAFLLAASQVLSLSDEDLATLGEGAGQVRGPLLGRAWVVALPGACDAPEILLAAASPNVVRARIEGGSARPFELDLAPGASAEVRLAPRAGPLVAVLRASGELDVRPRAVCAEDVEETDVGTARRVRRRAAGVAVPLWRALAAGESVETRADANAVFEIGGLNVSARPVRLRIERIDGSGSAREQLELGIESGQAAFASRTVAAGERVRLVNASEGGALVPLVYTVP